LSSKSRSAPALEELKQPYIKMTKKKIYDIVPPEKRAEILGARKAVKIKKAIPTSHISFSKRTTSKTEGTPRLTAFRQKRKLLFSLILFLIIGFGAYWFISTAKIIKINLFPKIEPFTLNTSVTFSTSDAEFSLPSSDLSQTVIPATPVELEKTFTKEFFSSEVTAEEKAKGTIRVYNKYSRTVTLVQGTRFLSSSEPTKQFHSTKKISIPAGGYIDVPVIASEPGKNYNIEPCVFSIPGLRNYSPPQLYYDVFGKSFSKMEGGRSETIRKITKEDLDNAKETLWGLAQQQIKPVLQEKVGSDFIILGDSVKIELLSSGLMNAEEGQEAKSFVYQIKTKATALKAETSAVRKFAKEYVVSNLPGHKDFVESLLAVNFVGKKEQSTEDLSEAKTKLNANLEIIAKVYSEIDENSLREIIKGRDKKDIARYALEVCPDLVKPPIIEFVPFWARKASLTPEKVEIKTIFE